MNFLSAHRRSAAQNARELDQIVKEWARDKTREELWVGLRDLGYFGAPVLSIEEVMADPHVKERGAFIQREHPTNGAITLLAPWIHMSGTPAAINDVAPTRGQHTDWVLQDVLGLNPEDVADLRAENMVK